MSDEIIVSLKDYMNLKQAYLRATEQRDTLLAAAVNLKAAYKHFIKIFNRSDVLPDTAERRIAAAWTDLDAAIALCEKENLT